jgi:hypothetical protein
MKKIFIILVVSISLTSCSLYYSVFDNNPCRTYISDDSTFRAFSESISTNQQFAEEKALFAAKQQIAVEVDDYILKKFNHQTFLQDPEFEGKITTARKTILGNISIVCSKTVIRKGMYKSYAAIEISKADIDRVVSETLKKEVR